jgi:putative SOS response-associated peptidase YedK
VPADGFFEWAKDGRRRQAWYIRRRDRRPFAFAGLWDEDTFTIVTCAPNGLVAPLHDRMPVVLPRAAHGAWLTAAADQALAVLRPAPTTGWEVYPVGRAIHAPDHDAPDCIEPLAGAVAAPPRQASLFAEIP